MDERKKQFKFKCEVRRVLMIPLHQNLLRSMLVIFKRVRQRQAAYIVDCQHPDRSVAYARLWSNHEQWFQRIVCPMLRDAFESAPSMRYIGFSGSLGACGVPLFGPFHDAGDEHELLILHVREAWGRAKQLWMYVLIYTQPPWSFIGLLHESASTVNKSVQAAQSFWRLALRLESSQASSHIMCCRSMPFKNWTVVREVCLLLESAGWQMTPRVREYAEALFPGMLHTMQHEAPSQLNMLTPFVHVL